MDRPDGEILLPPLKSEGCGVGEGRLASISTTFEGSTESKGAGCAAVSAGQTNKQPSKTRLEKQAMNPGMKPTQCERERTQS